MDNNAFKVQLFVGSPGLQTEVATLLQAPSGLTLTVYFASGDQPHQSAFILNADFTKVDNKDDHVYGLEWANVFPFPDAHIHPPYTCSFQYKFGEPPVPSSAPVHDINPGSCVAWELLKDKDGTYPSSLEEVHFIGLTECFQPDSGTAQEGDEVNN